MWTQKPSPKNEAARPPQQPSAAESLAAPGVVAQAVSDSTGERPPVACVGKSVVFKGELLSSEDMTIDGRVEGKIELQGHRLTIGATADIRADIVVGTVVVQGKVAGKILASDGVHLRDTASVEGDIHSPSIAIAEGAQLMGRIDMTSRDDASKLRLVAGS
jgi:cytoskeletal protein CcmA (bactofilin family)